MNFLRQKHSKNILFLFSFVFILGCGSQSNSTNSEAEAEDRAKQLKTMEPISGTYKGNLSNKQSDADPIPIEIDLFIVEEPNGLNSDGETKFRYSLKGRFKRLDFPPDSATEKTLLARYYPETSEISMSTAQGVEPSLSISAQINGTILSGEMFNSRGFMGTFSLTKEQ